MYLKLLRLFSSGNISSAAWIWYIGLFVFGGFGREGARVVSCAAFPVVSLVSFPCLDQPKQVRRSIPVVFLNDILRWLQIEVQ